MSKLSTWSPYIVLSPLALGSKVLVYIYTRESLVFVALNNLHYLRN